jgi:plasmid stabilization system protein ParE
VSRHRLTEDAERDLDEIVGFVALDSVAAARQVLQDLHSAMQQLAGMPRMGHVRRELAEEDVRFWVVHSYLIVYRAYVEPIEVVRVVSGFRDLIELLR